MGQYFYVADLDKREYVNPHSFGSGAKLYELQEGYFSHAVATLLADGIDGEDGATHPFIGRWACDRIVFAGTWGAQGRVPADEPPLTPREAATLDSADAPPTLSDIVRLRFRDVSCKAMEALLVAAPWAQDELWERVAPLARFFSPREAKAVASVFGRPLPGVAATKARSRKPAPPARARATKPAAKSRTGKPKKG